jgi:hypothetical protein
MSDFIYTVDKVGDEALTDSILDRSIVEIVDNSITIIGHYSFYNCKNLTTADFAIVTSIYEDAFRYATALKKVVLRSETLCTLSTSSVFSSSGIASKNGYIYVPRALVDTYKAATNWSTYATQFRALEDYTVDGTTTGELDTTKI